MSEIISVHLILRDPEQFPQVTEQCAALKLKVLSRRPGRAVAVAGDRDIIQGLLSQRVSTTERKVAIGRAFMTTTDHTTPEDTKITQPSLQPQVSELASPFRPHY